MCPKFFNNLTFSLSTLSIFSFNESVLIFSQKHLQKTIKHRYETVPWCLYNKVLSLFSLWFCKVLKKKLRNNCFPVNIVNFFEQCFYKICQQTHLHFLFIHCNTRKTNKKDGDQR